MYRTIDSRIWTDPKLRELWFLVNFPHVPYTRWKGRLVFKYRNHAALRAYVFKRDNFSCQWCGYRPPEAAIPADYDGRYSMRELVLDHILSLNHGGTNDAGNLMVLCDSCNSRKSCLLEGAGRVK